MIPLKVQSPAGSLEACLDERSDDICAEGIFVASKAPLEVGTIVKLSLLFEGGEVALSGMGRVAWRRTPVQAGPHGIAGMGVAFTQLDGTSKQNVDTLVSTKGEAAGVRYRQGLEESLAQPEEAPAEVTPEASAEDLPPPSGGAPISLAAEFMARDAAPPSSRQRPPAAPTAAPKPSATKKPVPWVPAVAAGIVLALCAGAMVFLLVVPQLRAAEAERVDAAMTAYREAVDVKTPSAARAEKRAVYQATLAKLSDGQRAELEKMQQVEFEARREAGLRRFFALSPEKQRAFLGNFHTRTKQAAADEGVEFRPFGVTAPAQTPEQRQLDERFQAMLDAYRQEGAAPATSAPAK